MSQSYVYDNRIVVSTYRDIFMVFVLFVGILFSLYPGKVDPKQILEERSNHALAAIYLENMLRLEPENIELIFATIRVSLERGNLNLAEELIGVLQTPQYEYMSKEVNLLYFKVLKARFLRYKEVNKKEEANSYEKKMKNLLKKLSKENKFDKKDALIWYSEAIVLKDKESALFFLKPLYQDKNIYALEQCVSFAEEIGYIKEKQFCLESLATLDGKSSEKWLNVTYSMYIAKGQNEKALKILQKLVKIDSNYNDEMARMQEITGRHKDASIVYLKLYNKSETKKEKKYYFFKAIDVLSFSGLNSEAVNVAQLYEDDYLNDDEVMQKLLYLYMALNALDKAQALSIKLLKEENK
jgi:uncharacterized alpha/beta hydrolase family protein